MGRNRGAVKYASGMATSRVGLVNMYIFGGGVISAVTLAIGLITSFGDVDAAIRLWMEWYAMKLIPWPLDEILLAETWMDLIISHAVTIGVGLVVASTKWWKNV